MTVKYPWMLLLLLLIPLCLWLRYHTARGVQVLFSNRQALSRLPRTWTSGLYYLRPLLLGLALAMLILTAARPQKGLEEHRTTTEVVDIVLLVDLSTSMEAIDLSTAGNQMNRLDAAKKVIAEFVGQRPADRIGMVGFAALPYTVSPLTLDHGWLLQRLEGLQTGSLEDGTAIGSAIASAVNRLRESDAESRLIILLTDGMNNRGSITPENAAQAAKAMGIRIYTVGAGSRGTALYPVTTPFGQKTFTRRPVEIDEETLKRIADITGGRYFRATDMNELEQVYSEIDSMEKTEIDIEAYTQYEEHFAPFLLVGLAALVIEKLLAFSRWGGLAA